MIALRPEFGFFLSLLLIVVSVLGCKAESSPQAVYSRLSDQIDHGRDFQAASIEVDRAGAIYAPRSQEWGWRFRILKAQILVSQFEAQKALELLRGDLPPALFSTDIAVRKLVIEGFAYRTAQDFEESKRKLTEAEKLAVSSQPMLVSEVLNGRGALEFDEKNYSTAETTFLNALTVARQQKTPRQEVAALVNLARLAIRLEHFSEGADRSQVALQLSRSLGFQSYEATTLGNLGWSYLELGDFDNALEFFKQAVDVSERVGIPGYELYWLAGVSNADRRLHDYLAAEAISRRTLERARRLKNIQTVAQCLNDLTEIMLRTGRLDEAAQYNQEATSIEQKGLDHFGLLESLLLSGRVATGKRDFDRAAELFRRVLDDPNAETPLRWEAQARLAELHDAEGSLAGAEQEYRKSIDTIETARSSIDRTDLRLSYLAGGIEVYEDYVEFLISHGRPDDALRIAELSRARTLAEGLSTDERAASPSLPTVHPQQLAQRLHATLLFYWLGQKHSRLWIITPSKTTCFTLPPATEIDPFVKRYREALLGTRDVLETANADGNKLYAMLVEPAKKLIPQGSRVILLPDASLYGLNFETLIVPEPKPHFWIEDVTLTTASSLTLLAAANVRPAPKEGNLLVVGNAAQSTPEFPPLRQAEAEMARIEQYFPESRREVLDGQRATPSAVLASKPERFAYVHFVTHGTASRAHPLDSAVILTPEGDSFKLYARDIVKHPLSAYLVTVSACNGSGTRAYSGEGLVGLSWAFLRAGAHNVIGALWEVSDTSTPQLMDKLYSGLTQGQDPAAALRAAKLSLLKSDSVYKKPFYWAPFQLYAGS